MHCYAIIQSYFVSLVLIICVQGFEGVQPADDGHGMCEDRWDWIVGRHLLSR